MDRELTSLDLTVVSPWLRSCGIDLPIGQIAQWLTPAGVNQDVLRAQLRPYDKVLTAKIMKCVCEVSGVEHGYMAEVSTSPDDDVVDVPDEEEATPTPPDKKKRAVRRKRKNL